MNTHIIRAWKDPLYRESLSLEEQVALPDHPAGIVELDIEQLKQVAGGLMVTTTAYTCTDYSYGGNNSCCPGGMALKRV